MKQAKMAPKKKETKIKKTGSVKKKSGGTTGSIRLNFFHHI